MSSINRPKMYMFSIHTNFKLIPCIEPDGKELSFNTLISKILYYPITWPIMTLKNNFLLS